MDKLIKYTGFLTIGLGILAYLIHTASVIGIDPAVWGSQTWILIFPVVGAILYLVFIQKALQTNTVDKRTHLILIISTGLACAALFWPGIPLLILFIQKSVRSDAPYWVALTESQTEAPIKPKSSTPSKAQSSPPTKSR